MSLAADRAAMQRAIELAELGRGFVEPNPLVGALVFDRAGNKVGEGWHRRFGEAHAEVNALDQAGAAAQKGTLFISLEPCCHHGKTPPCTDRIIAAGVARVVVAMVDPFPQVSGKGIAALEAAGIHVEAGVLASEAAKQNAAFLCLMQRNRPLIHAKWAMTLDGKIATAQRESKWITGADAREHADAFRGLIDGIIVGVTTVLSDDPMLVAKKPGPRVATRIVLDALARTPTTSKLASSCDVAPTMIVVGEKAPPERIHALRTAGCEVLKVPIADAGKIDLHLLMTELGRRAMSNVLVEGGAEVLGGFRDAGLIDAVRVYIAPKLLGGNKALTAVGGTGAFTLAEAWQLSDVKTKALGDDFYIGGTIAK